MGIEWFTARPGGADTPDWVRLPEELGGTVAEVIFSSEKTCVCGVDHKVRHLDLAGGVSVAECVIRGYLWYRAS